MPKIKFSSSKAIKSAKLRKQLKENMATTVPAHHVHALFRSPDSAPDVAPEVQAAAAPAPEVQAAAAPAVAPEVQAAAAPAVPVDHVVAFNIGDIGNFQNRAGAFTRKVRGMKRKAQEDLDRARVEDTATRARIDQLRATLPALTEALVSAEAARTTLHREIAEVNEIFARERDECLERANVLRDYGSDLIFDLSGN